MPRISLLVATLDDQIGELQALKEDLSELSNKAAQLATFIAKREQAIIRLVDAGANKFLQTYRVTVDEQKNRDVDWKNEFVVQVGNLAARRIEDSVEPFVVRRLLVSPREDRKT